MIVGNDISSYQGDIDFSTYVQNSNFVIIKVSEGIGFVDPKFVKNQTEFRARNFPIAYYHFAHPDLGNTAEAEADFFLQTIFDLRTGEVLCLDFEVSYSDAVKWCKAFLDEIYARCKVKPLIYLNKSQVGNIDWSPVVKAGYGLWLACYDSNPITGNWYFMAMQQWTNAQDVPGIPGNADGDYFFGTVDQFKAYGYKKPYSPSSSVSPSLSPSSSASPSLSPSNSQSPSASPSPSAAIPPVDPVQTKLNKLIVVINSQWNWIGANGWYNKLALLKKIING